MKYYVQCKLCRIGGASQVTWLPEKFANVGKYIKLYNKDCDVWEDGWKVVELYNKKEASVVESKERDFLKQRQVSDV
jgi:hypothetical protein